jgi:hypothetical protein
MKTAKLITIISILAITALAVWTIPAAYAVSEKSNDKSPVLTLEEIHSNELPKLSASIDEAMKAVEAGDTQKALALLKKAGKSVELIREGVAKQLKPVFVNDRCPIMGSPINPDRVSDDLVRDFKGQKVAFCCRGCPASWDKLSDAEKEAKLDNVRK